MSNCDIFDGLIINFRSSSLKTMSGKSEDKVQERKILFLFFNQYHRLVGRQR